MQFILLDSSPAAPTPYTSWAAIAIGVGTILYVAFIKPMLGGKKKKDPLARPAPEPGLARQRAVERDVSNLLVELSEMTRQMTAQIDTRAAKLDALIREADEKMALLRSLGHGQGGGGGPHGVLIEAKLLESDAVPMRPAEDSVPPVDPRHAEVYDLADEGQSAQDIARQTGRPRGEVELILALRGR
jgi:hypothetical protein